LLLVLAASLRQLKTAPERLRTLRVQATCKDPYTINMRLGSMYVHLRQFDKAIARYGQVSQKEHENLNIEADLGPSSLDQRYPLFAWERLDSEDPFDPRVHLGFGKFFQGYENVDQAEMEYKQVLALSPENIEARFRLAEIAHLRTLAALDPGSPYNGTQRPFESFEDYLTSNWQPPNHKGFLLTRCRVSTWGKRLDAIEVIGRSGLASHDQSALKTLKSAGFWESEPLQCSDMYGVTCTSDGKTKKIRIQSEMGSWNEVD
ncbi:MAG TPA: hypothetical protein V6C72_05910, partial [Chroococcales cyanobacterium]